MIVHLALNNNNLLTFIRTANSQDLFLYNDCNFIPLSPFVEQCYLYGAKG